MMRFASLLIGVGLLFAPALARAQTNESRAETLFQEGKSLMGAGRHAEACPKLAESQQLDPADGTLLALAMCHEAEGKLVPAWSEYTKLAGKADARRDRRDRAAERIAVLETKLARVTVKTGGSMDVTLDGAPVASTPVMPGKHVVEARAPGKRTEKREIDAAAGHVTELVLGPLEDEAVATAPRAAPSSRGSSLRIAGLATGAAGIVLLGVGTYSGVRAFQLSSDVRRACDGGCTAEGTTQNDDAKNHARIANVTIAAGAGLVAGGVLMYVLAPKASSVVTPYAGANEVGAVVTRTF